MSQRLLVYCSNFREPTKSPLTAGKGKQANRRKENRMNCPTFAHTTSNGVARSEWRQSDFFGSLQRVSVFNHAHLRLVSSLFKSGTPCFKKVGTKQRLEMHSPLQWKRHKRGGHKPGSLMNRLQRPFEACHHKPKFHRRKQEDMRRH